MEVTIGCDILRAMVKAIVAETTVVARIPARSVDGANVKRFDVAISSFTTPSSDDAAFFPFTRSFWVSVLFLLERLELPTAAADLAATRVC